MAAEEIHLLDIGTVFEVTLMDGDVVVDISSQLSMEILFLKPDKTLVIKTAVFTTDGTDGKMQYVTIANDLDQPKKWKIQGRVELSSGKWSSDIGEFTVHENLD